ncbi:cbb3-type cytochrome c oxidase subunit III [Maribacter spongiicola]|uniref:Cbb3-type cytochrome c oxidase subunit III n=2 Tax=Maribacter spongiicola TaxID=1206753 RepID=A0A4R7KB73_9FLAO|nr:cbb3-type cytochrome c oxidase subunit III [Maribacter spongiicola]
MHTKLLFLLFISCILFSCEPTTRNSIVMLNDYTIEEDFNLDIIAAEPLLKAPVAIDFDSKGRIWVAQMPGYMNDLQGSGEEDPSGSIVILEDLDNDGIADHSKVFMDSLIMPRALAHVYGGLLYAEPPYLWFVNIEDDKPVNKVMVDSIYAVEGNPEHQPNGLELNIDNWIYNAKSNFRYRRVAGIWKKEPTTFRGQWGITHDNFGRLYYNDNSRILLGDYALPNTLIDNKYFTPKASVNKLLTIDQRVYPAFAGSVNRGYAKGVLNADSILVNATAACSPLVYRGGAFTQSYDENVFICLPEGNLIKRTLLSFTGDSTIAKQAWENKEFITSADEGFRPVSLKNGPEGSMYVVDMHRGMIGHHAYMSPYLRDKAKAKELDTIVNFGRILKVSHEAAKVEVMSDFDALSGSELVSLLKNDNGWIRDRAQHYLVFKGFKNTIEEVKDVALHTDNQWSQIHALYVLEGWNELSFDFLTNVIVNSNDNVAAHALVLLKRFVSEENIEKAASIFKTVLERDIIGLDLYLGNLLGSYIKIDEERFLPFMMEILRRRQNNSTIVDAIIGGLSDVDAIIYKNKEIMNTLKHTPFVNKLARTISDKNAGIMNSIFTIKVTHEDTRTSGAKMFFEICASCHGANGKGIEGLAPPLMKSEHVKNTERLALIILHGLEGPVHVNGEEYNINLAMPGLIRNETISDTDIANIISYVTSAFSDDPKRLSTKRIQELRSVKSSTGMEFTEFELQALDN